jgi:protein-disulfide isomerase
MGPGPKYRRVLHVFAAVAAIAAGLVLPSCAPSTGAASPTAAEGPDVTLEGVDTSQLTTRERREWGRLVSELLAPCPDVPVSIAQCVREKRACARCVEAANHVLRGVRDGLPASQVEKRYKDRFDPAHAREVPIDGSPVKGPEGAPVTIVEFADFECPFCAKMYGKLSEAYAKNPGQVRVVYKFCPLPMHEHAEIAARAGIAAYTQGKFWEMHDRMYSNQKRLTLADLEGYARDLGLDMAKFREDLESPQTSARLERDKKLADAVGVSATPTLFINGREFDLRQDLQEWLASELKNAPRSGAPLVQEKK